MGGVSAMAGITANRGRNEYNCDGPVCRIEVFGLRGNQTGTIIIDAESAEKCRRMKWHIKMRNGLATAVCGRVPGPDTGPSVRMHHFLFGPPPAGSEYDHINREPLDNRKANLRIVSATQNQWNRGLTRANTVGTKGVALVNKKWRSRIWYESRQIHLGYFRSKEEAACAYDAAALRLRREFAVLNTGGA